MTISFAANEQTTESVPAGFMLPAMLTYIGEEAFAGIPVARVEVPESVTAIAARAFAGCANLHEIVIPPSVTSIDDNALEGCTDVTVYGKTGSEAQRFANVNSYTFIDLDAKTQKEEKPVELPFLPVD